MKDDRLVTSKTSTHADSASHCSAIDVQGDTRYGYGVGLCDVSNGARTRLQRLSASSMTSCSVSHTCKEVRDRRCVSHEGHCHTYVFFCFIRIHLVPTRVIKVELHSRLSRRVWHVDIGHADVHTCRHFVVIRKHRRLGDEHLCESGLSNAGFATYRNLAAQCQPLLLLLAGVHRHDHDLASLAGKSLGLLGLAREISGEPTNQVGRWQQGAAASPSCPLHARQ